MTIILCTHERDDLEASAVQKVLSLKVDGVALVPTQYSDAHVRSLLRNNVPTVLLERPLADVSVDCVIQDDERGGYLATKMLLENGHRRIGYISSYPHISADAARRAGYERALSEYGIAFDASLVMSHDEHLRRGRDGTILRAPLLQRASALFVFNDLIAYNIIAAYNGAGLRIPEDLSLVGFDGFWVHSTYASKISSIAMPVLEMTRRATHLLFSRIETPDRPSQQVAFDVVPVGDLATIAPCHSS